jgi:2-polyprenyl-3-methyl-5-hydroxy-6-metoxy-1,4-benzoquinol methylase
MIHKRKYNCFSGSRDIILKVMIAIPPSSQSSLYYSLQRSDILPFISHLKDVTTLDVGCGEGATSLMLQQKSIAKRLLGIEYSPAAAQKASGIMDELKTGNIEVMDLSAWRGTVDLLLCLDVLEHLYDPWKALQKLAACVKSGGMIIASIPNIQNKSVLFSLLRGQWRYEEYGLMDRTHIRFFTHQTARELMEQAGFQIESESSTMGSKSKLLNGATLGLFHRFLAMQYLFAGRLVA